MESEKKRRRMSKVAVITALYLYACGVDGMVLSGLLDLTEDVKAREPALSFLQSNVVSLPPPQPFLMVPLTLIQGADSKGAVCLDGTLPGYHLHRGSGLGENSWLVMLQGGAWCNSTKDCIEHKTTPLGSSKFMEEQLPFIGILSNKSEENPDFFNWNRVKIRYCDGASFSGQGQNKNAQLYFRGQRIWSVAMEALMAEGMQNATQALLSGCSAGGLASIIHCDEFRDLFPRSTKVKCLSDAGMFLDVVNVAGRRTLRNLFEAVVRLQCFFPQNLIDHVKTPLFILNAAYDAWQLQNSLVSPSADPHGSWNPCIQNHARCNLSEIHVLQDFRNQMRNAVKVFSKSNQNGLFINSCFVHCQAERGDAWFSAGTHLIRNKSVARSVGDWYFDRADVKAIDCAYPCDTTCHYIFYR